MISSFFSFVVAVIIFRFYFYVLILCFMDGYYCKNVKFIEGMIWCVFMKEKVVVVCLVVILIFFVMCFFIIDYDVFFLFVEFVYFVGIGFLVYKLLKYKNCIGLSLKM